MYMDMPAGMSGWMWLMMLAWAVFVLGLIAFTVWLLRRAIGGPARPSGRTILEERYARGEIDTDEFKRRLETLQS